MERAFRTPGPLHESVAQTEVASPMFDSIPDALAAIRNGECVVVVDDERRENEGDLICAAQFATPEQINFMATEARGLICLAMEGARLDALDLPLMVDRSRHSLVQLPCPRQSPPQISLRRSCLATFCHYSTVRRVDARDIPGSRSMTQLRDAKGPAKG